MIFDRIVALLFRFKYGLPNASENVTDQLAEIKTVLICMPKEIEEYGAALKALKRLKNKRRKWKIAAVTSQQMMNFIDERLKIKVLPFSKEDITFFGLPKTNVKKTFEKPSYDLFLDFRPNFDLFSLALLHITNTPIKVCLDCSDKSPFFNIIIRVNPAESLANKYGVMVKYIDVMSSTAQPADETQKT